MLTIEPCCFFTQLQGAIANMREQKLPFATLRTNGDVSMENLIHFITGQTTASNSRVIVSVPYLTLGVAKSIKELLNAEVRDNLNDPIRPAAREVLLLCGHGRAHIDASPMDMITALDLDKYGKRLRVAVVESRQTLLLTTSASHSVALFGNVCAGENLSHTQEFTTLCVCLTPSFGNKLEKEILSVARTKYLF